MTQQTQTMKATIIHPAVGKIPGKKYIRAWQMEPLPAATIAALMPDDVEVSFFDDRMEDINYDHPADIVCISIETYTAKRSYQIASEYRRRGVTILMGGFHATLCTDEVAEYANCVVVGDAENVWHKVLDDFKKGTLQKIYRGEVCDFSSGIIPDRSIFKGKNYINITLLEAGRGCRFSCEFCAIHNFFQGQHHYRNVDTIVEEIKQLKNKARLFFFVDDNIVAEHQKAKELFKALIPLKIKWVGQADITISKDPELIQAMVESGCQGVLIGFETLNTKNLEQMRKGLLPSVTEIEKGIQLIHKAGIRIYATFLFGYDNDTPEDFERVLKFCVKNKFFIVGFNNLTPFPGTELYTRLEKENRLLYKKWWLDEAYTYGQIPFKSEVDNQLIEKECRRIRRQFYSPLSILYRMSNRVNVNSLLMLSFFTFSNFLLRNDTMQRKKFPLGDKSYNKQLLKKSEIDEKSTLHS